MRIVASVILIMLVQAPAAAQKTPGDPELDRCLAMKTAQPGVDQVTGCYSSTLHRGEAQLARAQEAIGKRANRQKLGTVELRGISAWRTYREQWCAFEEKFEADPQARPSTGLMCRYEVTRAYLSRVSHAN